MTLLEKICEELGVEIGEEWLGNDGYYYKITEEGLIGFYYPTSDDRENFDVDLELWASIILGDLKPVWKPKDGEQYYIPDPLVKDLHDNPYWTNGGAENIWLDRGLVFKTKEEAIAAANKMLNALKEG